MAVEGEDAGVIITAALAWFDEPLEDLDLCIRSLPVIADRLVAVDGGYERYPGAEASSPKDQAAFIRQTAKEVGLDVKVVTPCKVWRGQVEKRTHLLGLAAEGSDWIVGVDADHVLHGVRYSARHELAGLDERERPADAVDITYYTPLNYDRSLQESAAGEWHAGLAGDYALITGLFRSLPGYRVERHHWWYSALKDGERHWVWGGDSAYPRVRVHQMKAPLMVEHRCLFRQTKHILANREFCKDRERLVREHGQEDPVDRVAVAA